MDMRFDEFLTPAETKRYGLATTLRLAQTVTLAADDAAFDWSARVTNPMPIRCGFKLWYLIRPSLKDVRSLVFPATTGVGHNAPRRLTWDANEIIGNRNLVFFAAGMRQPYAGWYYPDPNYNLMVVANRRMAPGGKQVLWANAGYVELWGGNHEVFEEAGRMLPPLGAFEINTRIYPAGGIGKVHYANRHVALSLRETNGRGEIRLVTTKPRTVSVAWRTADGKKGAVTGKTGPRKPLRIATASAKLDLRVTEGKATLADVSLPIAPPPRLTDEEFRALQLRVHGEDRKTGERMPGGKGMLAELTDLTAEHHYSLWRARGRFRDVLKTATDRAALLDAARRHIRVSDDFGPAVQGLEKVLDEHPDETHANLYLGMILWEQGKPDKARPYLQKADELPGGQYLLALHMKSKGKTADALKHARKVIELGRRPRAHYYGKDDPAWKLHQTGATLPATRARLLAVLCLRELGGAINQKEAARQLNALLQMDPALIEARLLEGDKEKLATLSRRNPSGMKAAREALENLRKGTWPGVGRPAKRKD
jgi:tetratricopeptide (TPR) repeat protein